MKFNLFNIIRLIKKNIKIHFKNINKFFHIIINEKILKYTKIKNNLYYLKTINIFISSLNSKNLYLLFVIDQNKNNDFKSNIKYYFILNSYIKKKSEN